MEVGRLAGGVEGVVRGAEVSRALVAWEQIDALRRGQADVGGEALGVGDAQPRDVGADRRVLLRQAGGVGAESAEPTTPLRATR